MTTNKDNETNESYTQIKTKRAYDPFFKSLFTGSFRNMSITHRVYLSQGLILLFFFLATLIVAFLNYQEKHSTERLLMRDILSINKTASKTSEDLLLLNNEIFTLTTNADNASSVKLESLLPNTHDNMQNLLNKISNLGNQTLRNNLLAKYKGKLSKAIEDIPNGSRKIITLYKSDLNKAHLDAHKLSINVLSPLVLSMQELQNDAFVYVHNLGKSSSKTLETAQTWLLYGFLIALSVSVLTLYTIKKSLKDDVTILLDSLIKIADGNLVDKINIKARDEVGSISRFVNNFVNNTQRTLCVIDEDIKKVQQMVEKNLSAIDTTSDTITTQRAKAQDVSSSTMLLESSVEKVAEFARSTLAEVKIAEEASDTCRRTMQDNITTTHTLSDRLRASSNAVQEVSEMGDKIESIVKTISDIADQTNLLALNANIEAARAGEYGRGFAIVADEVRELAKKTAISTKEVSNTIKNLSVAVSNSVEVMANCESQMIDSVNQSSRANSSIEEIMGIIATISDMSEQIVNSCQEQANSASEINHSIANILKLSEDNYENMINLNSSMSELNVLSTQQETLIKKFKIK